MVSSDPGPVPAADWTHPVLGRLLRVQQAARRRPWLMDIIVFVVIAVAPLQGLRDEPGGHPPRFRSPSTDLPLGVLIALAVLFVLPLLWRRKAPALVFAIVLPSCVLLWSLGLFAPAVGGLLVALYSLALRGSLRALAWAAAVTAAGLWLSAWFILPTENWLLAGFLLTGTATAAVALGLMVRIRRQYLAALEDRATRLETERDQRVRLTAAAERSRVAREMHDIVGHNLSVIVGLADGAATLATNRKERAAEALWMIGDTGRQALDELRRVLGVLRDDSDKAQLTPQPGIADLDALLARASAAGLAVTYRTAGNLAELGPGIQLAVYRIVQEALTNTLKHAGARAAVQVVVAAEDGAVRIRVTDTRPAEGVAAASVGDEPGHGLVGIRQRAALYDGTVTLGPHGRGWIVDVMLVTPAEHSQGEPVP
jgi:signal transduction histidine kinase